MPLLLGRHPILSPVSQYRRSHEAKLTYCRRNFLPLQSRLPSPGFAVATAADVLQDHSLPVFVFYNSQRVFHCKQQPWHRQYKPVVDEPREDQERPTDDRRTLVCAELLKCSAR